MPRRLRDKIAIMTASQVTIVEMVPAIARLPVLKMAPRSGVRRVTPQVGQPAPRAMRPVMRPARSRLEELSEALTEGTPGVILADLASLALAVLVVLDALDVLAVLAGAFLAEGWGERFLFQRRTMIPIKIPCRIAIEKTGSQSRKGWLMPKMARKASPRILRPFGKPKANMSSNLVVPLDNKFISIPKKKKLGMKPYQNRFSLVASKIPLPARPNSSNHFLQFIYRL